MALTFIVTDAGRAALVNAQHDGTTPVRIAACGVSGTAIAASRATAALPDEIKRIATISGDVVAADTIHVIVRDDSTAVFTARSIALYLADGTLFGAYGQPDPIIIKSASALMLLAVDITFADIGAAQLMFGDANFLDPPATTDRQGVVELATVQEAQAGADAQRAVTPAVARASVVNWIGYVPVNRAGDQMTGALTAAGFVGVRSPVSGYRLNLNVYDTDGHAVWFAIPGDGATVTAVMSLDTRSATPAVNFNWTPTASGNAIWHAGNDGAGSGLDADLLDGRDSGWYTDIVARIGYTPVNRAGDTMTGALTAAGFVGVRSPAGYRLNLNVFDTDGHAVWFAIPGDGATATAVMGLDTRSTTPAVNFNWGPTAGGNPIWHAGNDGAGSGLDADLLDGHDSGWYTDIVSRLGYAPVSRGGDQMTGGLTAGGVFGVRSSGGRRLNLNVFDNGYATWFASPADDGAATAVMALDTRSTTPVVNFNWGPTAGGNAIWHAGNDGAGSGLDADLLDGQDGGWYADVPARLGYAPVNRAGDTMAGALTAAGFVGVRSAAGYRLNLNAYDNGSAIWFAIPGDGATVTAVMGLDTRSTTPTVNFNWGPTAASNPIWHAGNDGAGSGLDADLLDGRDSGWYTDIVARLGYTPVRQGGGVGQQPNGVAIGWSGSRLKATVDVTDLGNIVFDSDLDRIATDDRREPGTDTVTVPAWARRAEVHIVGGGGAGGASGASWAGGGGGAGGYVFGTVAVTPGAVLNRTVGAGGAGGGGAGGDGGASSLDGVGTATGGSGAASSSNTCAGGGGGNGNVATAGARGFSGGTGCDGPAQRRDVPGGAGAAGPFGGQGRTGAGGGTPGVAPGAGGGGAWLSTGTGGAGAPGAVLITWLA